MVLLQRRRLLLAAALVVCVLTAVGCGASGTRRGATGSPRLVTVHAGGSGRRVPFGFLGLSLEYPAVEAYAGTDPRALDPVFLQLVRNLDPGQAPVHGSPARRPLR